MSQKRSRTPTDLLSSSPSPSLEPAIKATRTTQKRQLLCTLPPTCNPPINQPTSLANSKELETHYATYHAHVCEELGCGCVFPEARLLELHQTECHDPIAAVRKDRGEKIFACHLATCARLFATPKTRRLHLIEAHGYPKEYFFAVTNKGVGGLLKKWGEGASMVRGTWKPRDDAMDAEDASRLRHTDDNGNDDTLSSNEDEAPSVNHEQHKQETPGLKRQLPEGPLIVEEDEDDLEPLANSNPDPSIDVLSQSMDALSLIPPNIRFGRGTKRGGYASIPSHAASRARAHASQHVRVPDAGTDVRPTVDNSVHSTPQGSDAYGPGRGRPPHHSRGGHHLHAHHPARPPFPPRGLGARGGFLGRGRISVAGLGVRGRGRQVH